MQNTHYILRLLDMLRHTPAATLEDLSRNLYYLKFERRETAGLGLHHRWNSVDKIAHGIRPALASLLDLGILKSNENGTYSFAATPPPPPVPPDAGSNTPGDDGPGSGLGEILAHPILFSYGEADFEDALARALRNFNA